MRTVDHTTGKMGLTQVELELRLWFNHTLRILPAAACNDSVYENGRQSYSRLFIALRNHGHHG